jgi:iron complex transport system substrate-binding protein
MRIVSLLASGTEIVCGLGAGSWLVGRSHECDSPGWVQTLPACTRPAFDTDQSSKDIDAEVKRRLRAGEPLYHVDAELLTQLQPDVVLTQVHCDVCAVTPGDVARAGVSCSDWRLVALSASNLAEVDASIGIVGQALGLGAAADALRGRLADRLHRVRSQVAMLPRPSVALVEWIEPLFSSGNWGPELIGAAGGRPLLSEAGQPSMPLPWEHIVNADPDYLVIAPCGFDLSRTEREAGALASLPGWSTLRAVGQGRVVLADGNRYFNRSGPTVIDSVEILAEVLHGVQVGPRRHAGAWRMHAGFPGSPETTSCGSPARTSGEAPLAETLTRGSDRPTCGDAAASHAGGSGNRSQ